MRPIRLGMCTYQQQPYAGLSRPPTMRQPLLWCARSGPSQKPWLTTSRCRCSKNGCVIGWAATHRGHHVIAGVSRLVLAARRQRHRESPSYVDRSLTYATFILSFYLHQGEGYAIRLIFQSISQHLLTFIDIRSVCQSVCQSVCRITAKVISRFHWNVLLWLGLTDPVPDTNSESLFHFSHRCGIGDFKRFISIFHTVSYQYQYGRFLRHSVKWFTPKSWERVGNHPNPD